MDAIWLFVGVSTIPGLWTGLDCGLDNGLVVIRSNSSSESYLSVLYRGFQSDFSAHVRLNIVIDAINYKCLIWKCFRYHVLGNKLSRVCVLMMSDLASDDLYVVISSGDEEAGSDHRCGVFMPTKRETLPSEVSR